MLEMIRRNVRHPYIQALLGLVILVFIFFFGWSMRASRPNYVAKVNGTTIDYRSYQKAYNGLVRLYQEAYKQDLTPDKIRQMGLGRRALDQEIDQVLLLQEARRRGIHVTDEELQRAIEAVPAFQDSGHFDKRLYLRVLDANRLTPLEYEASKRKELVIAKVEQAIRAEAVVTDAEVKQEYIDRNAKIDLAYVAFEPKALEPEVKVTPEALAEFYDAEKESFRTPEKRSARYTLIAADDYMAEVQATEQELHDEYDYRSEDFAVPEAVHARHILFRLPPNASPKEVEAVKKKAEKVRAEILAGASFAKMAEKYSADTATKEKGGDLGTFERGAMLPEFEKEAFSLKPGQVSEPVRTAYGFHLIQVESRRPAKEPTFDEVKDRLITDVKHRKALEEAYAAADNLLMDLEDGQRTWDTLGKTHKVVVTPPLAKDGTIQGVAKPKEFVALLFGLDPSGPGDLLETDKGTYLISVGKVVPSAIPPLDEVRKAVEARYRSTEARRLAETRAQEFLTAARDKGWAQELKANGRTAERTGPFAKKGGAVPKIGWAPDLKEAAFTLAKVGDVAEKPYEVSGVYYAIELASQTPADMEKFPQQEEKIRAELLPQKQAEHVQKYLEELRKKADIEINQDMLL